MQENILWIGILDCWWYNLRIAMEDKFKLWKKWFWVGAVVGFFNVVAGLVYSFALMTEAEHRREGIILLVWTLSVFLLLAFLVGPYIS